MEHALAEEEACESTSDRLSDLVVTLALANNSNVGQMLEEATPADRIETQDGG